MYDELKGGLRNLMKQTGKSQKQISKEIGISSATVSQFLNGTYTGNNEEISKRVEQYLTVEKDRLNKVNDEVFYTELHNTKSVLFACGIAHNKNLITLVCGEAGAGKTTALNYYVQQNSSSIMVTANSCTKTATSILGLICQELHVRAPMKKAVRMDIIVKRLKDTNRLLIIDEADHLNIDALQAVRNINDMAGIGIVLAGNNKIYLQMKSPRTGGVFDQIRTRIVIRKYMDNIFTVEEMKNMFPELDSTGIGIMIRIAEAESLRKAKQLYEIANEYANIKGIPLSAQTLRSVQEQMIGDVI